MSFNMLLNACIYCCFITSVLSRPSQHLFIAQNDPYILDPYPPKHDVPAIGIDLVEDYGIVAARFPNGTNTIVAEVKGNEAYRELIRRLADPQRRHIAPPYNNAQERFEDAPRQLLRQHSRNMNVPVSDTVHTLRDMLTKLEVAARDTLGRRQLFDVVALATPYLPGLHQEDLDDALLLAWMDTPVSLGDVRFEAHLSRSVAALAGNGLGLCEKHTNIASCVVEESRMPSQNVLTVHFGPEALDLSVDIGMRVAKQPPPQWREMFAYYEPSLGLNHLPSLSTSSSEYADEDAYWSAIYSAIQDIMYTNWLVAGGNDLHAVFLTGEHALDQRFLKVVARVFVDLLGNPEKPPVIYNGKCSHDRCGDGEGERGTKGVVVRGAAELAWRVKQLRWSWDMVWGPPQTKGLGMSMVGNGDTWAKGDV